MEVMIIIVLWMLLGYVTCGWALKEVLKETTVSLSSFVVFFLTVIVLFGWPVVLLYALFVATKERKKT